MVKKKKEKFDVVPFQLCPKCNGEGSIRNYTYDTTSGLLVNQCDLCYGAKVIPMAKIPKK